MKRSSIPALVIALVLVMATAAPSVATFKGSNRKIVFTGKNGKLMTMNANGSGKRAIVKKFDNAEAPQVAPNGQWVVFGADPDGSNYVVYRVRMDGSKLKRLSAGTSSAWCPSYSPTGKKIAWRNDAQLWTMSATGTNKLLVGAGINGECPKYTKSGNHIIFANNNDIWKVEANGDNLENLTTTEDGGYPDISPNGKKILFTSSRDGDSELWTMDLNGGNLEQLTNGANASYTPAWSPDGKKIAYHSGSGAIFVKSASTMSNGKQIGQADPAYGLAWQAV